MTMVLIILILLLVVAYFYLKCTVMASLSTLVLAILTTLITLSCYEVLAELFISRGYGIQWAQCGCYVLAFILSFALLRALRDLLAGGHKIDLGNPLKISVAIICGLLSGIIACGNIFIAIGLAPVHHKMIYSRFSPDSKVSLKNPQKTFLNTDGVVAGLYSLISRGSMATGKSFSTLHADYLSQLYLNRLKTQDGVLAVTSRESLTIPTGKTKRPVRIWELAEQGKVTVVRMGLGIKNVPDGGAGNPAQNGKVAFCPAQVRLICKPTADAGKPAAGTATPVWPIGLLDAAGQFTPTQIDEIIEPPTKGLKNQPVWIDAVFEVPSAAQAVFLQFKQNAMVELPAPVATSDEIEKDLDGKDEESQEGK